MATDCSCVQQKHSHRFCQTPHSIESVTHPAASARGTHIINVTWHNAFDFGEPGKMGNAGTQRVVYRKLMPRSTVVGIEECNQLILCVESPNHGRRHFGAPRLPTPSNIVREKGCSNNTNANVTQYTQCYAIVFTLCYAMATWNRRATPSHPGATERSQFQRLSVCARQPIPRTFRLCDTTRNQGTAQRALVSKTAQKLACARHWKPMPPILRVTGSVAQSGGVTGI